MSIRLSTLARGAALALRVVAGALALTQIAGALRRVPAVTVVPDGSGGPTISVVVPARDEERRLAPLLGAVIGAPDVIDVLVVDDQSSDGTAALARSHQATVVEGAPLPPGWVGKAWAMQQGLDEAAGDWIVFLDADTCPDPDLPRALVGRAVADGLDLASAAGRFDCPTRPLAWLHPAMLTTLVYRYGPPGRSAGGRTDRLLANGQCIAVRRDALLAAGGLRAVADHTVEDVALVRHLARGGGKVAFLDASALLTVRMYSSAGEAFHGWSRSLALPGVESVPRQLVGLVVVALAQALPLIRLATHRADVVDIVMGIVRLGTLAGTSRAYTRRNASYWASPAADVVAVAALARGIVARRQRWRGRTYPAR